MPSGREQNSLWFRTMGTPGTSGQGAGHQKSSWKAQRGCHHWALECLLHSLLEDEEGAIWKGVLAQAASQQYHKLGSL